MINNLLDLLFDIDLIFNNVLMNIFYSSKFYAIKHKLKII